MRMSNVLVTVILLVAVVVGVTLGIFIIRYNSANTKDLQKKMLVVTGPLSTKKLNSMLQGSPLDKDRAATYLMIHPDAANPIYYSAIVQLLWSRGDRLQAAFWFYLFEIRTLPWAQADKTGDDIAAVRTPLLADLKHQIESWVGADLKTWNEVVTRAISFESKIPLDSERPNGVSRADWQSLVQNCRKESAAKLESRMKQYLANPSPYIENRKAHGLSLGPLKESGDPLPDSWR